MKRLSKRVAAGLGLSALFASALFATVTLSATGAGASSSDVSTLKIRACLDSGGLVNVQMRDPNSGSTTTTYQVALTGPSRDTTLYPDGGGPTLMQVGSDTVAAKLSVPPNADDVVEVVTTTAPSSVVTTAQITSSCSSYTSVDFPSKPAKVDAQQNCNGSTGAVTVTLQNNMYPTETYQKETGLDSVNYTVVLVKHSTGQLATPLGWLAKFDTVGATTKCLYAPDGAATTYDVRAIAVNGAVKTDSVTLGPVGKPTPTPTPKPTKPTPPPTHPTPKPSHTSSSPAPSTPPGTPAVSSSPPVAGSSSNTTVTTPADGNAGTGGGASSAATTSTPPSAGRTTRSAAVTPARPAPSSTGTSSSVSVLSPSSSILSKRIAEPPLDTASRIFVWQSGPAMIVLIDALAISALIGGVVWNGKRR